MNNEISNEDLDKAVGGIVSELENSKMSKKSVKNLTGDLLQKNECTMTLPIEECQYKVSNDPKFQNILGKNKDKK
jgi:hypothetical protein